MANSPLPVVIPDRLLISPGIWNDNEYSSKEISDAFARTSWDDKQKISLWLNHDDTNTSAFVGYVKNPKLASEGRVFGDLEIWDEKMATMLTQAMAKFGVSAKIKGEEDKKGKMHNFTFENFSVVTVPACSEAYINLSKKEGNSKSQYLTSKDNPTFKEVESSININTIERRLKDMEERLQDEEKKEEVEDKPEEKEESEKENSKKLSEKFDELSAKFDKLISLLSKKLEEEAPAEEPAKEEVAEDKAEEKSEEPKAEEVEKENDKELTLVKKELAEIKEKLNAPKSKTVRNLSSNTVGDTAKFSNEEFAHFLTSVDKPVKII